MDNTNIDALFDQGLAHYQGGRYDEARTIFEKIQRAEPRHFDAVYLLGLIAVEKGDLPRALEFYDRAIALNPEYAPVSYNRGVVLQDLGRPQDALASYDRFIQLQPDYPQVHYNRGGVLQDLGRHEEALASYDRAIGLKPDYALAYSGRGMALWELGRHQEALASYDRAIGLGPGDPTFHNNRAGVLWLLGRLEEAVAGYDQALALKPDFALALSGRGGALLDLERAAEALPSLERAIELQPDSAWAHTRRGEALRKLERYEEALESQDRAIELDPNLADAHNNRGVALHQLMRFEEAIAGFRRALDLDPGNDKARVNLCTVLLLLGQFREAWLLHEYRGSVQKWSARLRMDLKSVRDWQKSDLVAEPLLVVGEQGLGDEIMFSSVMPDILAVQPHTTLISDKRLVGLFERSFPGLTVIPRPSPDESLSEERLPERKCLVGSLMKFFRCQLEEFPGTPYLLADPERRKEMRRRLDALGNEAKIGIMWRGGVGGQRERLRSVSLDDFLPLFHGGAAHWVSLSHLPEAEDEIAAFGDRTGTAIHHWADILRSDEYDDTAALLAELDAVVSVTCTVAHCAAALGVPTHVLVNRLPEWRYGYEGAAIPWYNAMTLYRQTNHWPIEAIREKLNLPHG